MAELPTAISVDHVEKDYPRARTLGEMVRGKRRGEAVTALRGLSLHVARGSVHGLLGANGAGKTTLLKILATLVLPTRGAARVAGHDVVAEPEAVRASLGMVVAEERSFYWRLSGRDNLLFFAALQDLAGRERTRRVEELLDIVGLASDARRPYRDYSTGMRQRLSIARGLLARPAVLLMDEPTRALDPPSAAAIRRLVRERLAAQDGTTVLIATHDMLEAETTCDRLSLVEAGRVIAEGTASELKRPLDRATRTVITVLASQGREQPSFAQVLGDGLVGQEGPDPDGGWRLTVAGGASEVADHVRRLVEAGARVCEVRPDEASLTALFERVARERAPAESLA